MSTLSDQRDAINLYSGFRLANIARVGIPATDDEYGVSFLSIVREAVIDYSEHGALTDDALHEIADSAVPVYNLDIMRTLVGLTAWDEDVDSYPTSGSIVMLSSCALYGVAYRLASALKDELDAAAGEDAQDAIQDAATAYEIDTAVTVDEFRTALKAEDDWADFTARCTCPVYDPTDYDGPADHVDACRNCPVHND